MLIDEKMLGTASREEFETTLCVSDVPYTQRGHQEVESMHQQVSVPCSLVDDRVMCVFVCVC